MSTIDDGSGMITCHIERVTHGDEAENVAGDRRYRGLDE